MRIDLAPTPGTRFSDLRVGDYFRCYPTGCTYKYLGRKHGGWQYRLVDFTTFEPIASMYYLATFDDEIHGIVAREV